MKNPRPFLMLFFLSLILVNCGVETDNKEQIFLLWTNAELPKEVKTLNGKYWESGHYIKEYEVYIHLKSTEKWWVDFKKNNQLDTHKSSFSEDIQKKLKSDYKGVIKIPKWFKPSKNSTIYQKGESEFYWDNTTKDLYIHEIQL